MARITIPYAVTDFADLRERGFYYVDKTNYIPGLEDYNAPVFLRPRRFGKSLLISSRLTTTTVQRRIVLKNSSAVLGLANILRKSIINLYGLPKAYILIDEYDNFTNQLITSYNDPLYEKVTTSDSFLRTFFKVIKKGIGEGTVRTCFCTVYCLSPWTI